MPELNLTEATTPATGMPTEAPVASEAPKPPTPKVVAKKPTAAKPSLKPKAVVAKKPATKVAPKPTPKKEKTVKTKPAAKEPRAPKEGLRKPQTRILQALAKNPNGLRKEQIKTKAKIQKNWVKDYLGRDNPAERPEHDALKGYPSLLTQGFVRLQLEEGKDSQTIKMYSITKKGEAALAKYNAE